MPCDTIVVEAQFDPSKVTIDGCNVIGAEGGSLNVSPGTSVGVDVFVRNENPDVADVTVDLVVGGDTNTATVQVPAEGVGTVQYDIVFQEEGEFNPEPTVTLANRAN